MKLKYIIVIGLCLGSIRLIAQNKAINKGIDRPKLVIGIVIDQMRWDYLYRYYDRYSDGGFKRLLNKGYSCENANIDYVPSYTAVGHSTIYTGSVPSIHGITANDFIIQETGKSMYCTEDSTVVGIGTTTAAGKMSPKNLLVSTITDELKLATNFKAKVLGIALKDRGGILPAGHSADAAYWYDGQSGNWITSSYYMNSLPSWVEKFNALGLAKRYLQNNWNTLYPIGTYQQSAADENPFETPYGNGKAPIFPVNTSNMAIANFDAIRATPFGNTLTFDIAKAAVENEQLGGRSVTDFLALSLSSTDYVGHQFGPNSIEAEDTYLRLDKDLSSFLSFLDSKVGKENYTLFLTADHGAAHNAGYLESKRIPGGIWQSTALFKDLNAKLLKKYGVDKIALRFTNYQVHLNQKMIKAKGLDELAIRQDCVDFFTGKPGVNFVVDCQHAMEAVIPEVIKSKIINGYNSERSGQIQVVLKPGWYASSSKTGTSHGTWNPYDTHIPLLFMGWGIKKGHSVAAVNMTDISPTLAALLHIQTPNGSIGKPISEVLK